MLENGPLRLPYVTPTFSSITNTGYASSQVAVSRRIVDTGVAGPGDVFVFPGGLTDSVCVTDARSSVDPDCTELGVSPCRDLPLRTTFQRRVFRYGSLGMSSGGLRWNHGSDQRSCLSNAS
jgi:hypothetical protein